MQTRNPKRRETTGKVLHKANYGNATLSDVTRVVLRSCPKSVMATDEKHPQPTSPTFNPGV